MSTGLFPGSRTDAYSALSGFCLSLLPFDPMAPPWWPDEADIGKAPHHTALGSQFLNHSLIKWYEPVPWGQKDWPV